MDAFLTQPLERQRLIYEEASRRLGLSASSVEKDLWVCWTLRALFRLSLSGPHLTFKGGTSLSKGWKLIDRFSEDIDIVITASSWASAVSTPLRMRRATSSVRSVLKP